MCRACGVDDVVARAMLASLIMVAALKDQHFFDAMTAGYGAMYSHAARVQPQDRWAIIAYVRALQLSQHATLDDVPAAEQERLRAAATP